MFLKLPILLATAAALTLDEATTYQLVAENEHTSPTEIAELFYAGRWKLALKETLVDDEYCVSLACDGRPLAPCFNTKKLSFPLADTLAIELANGSVAALSLLETASETPTVRLVAAHTIPSPREDIPHPHVAAPVAEKSFIQKYWMYIVPPLIILMVMSPQ
ncbi:hypothetical protein KL906_003074 [Ogataea polymorpha]|nr:hypothetical protein KL906_003074 [Ogataea polymorpha]KAG7920966.1 hypothetical protein KL927_000210 [Ogataea polymorpha]